MRMGSSPSSGFGGGRAVLVVALPPDAHRLVASLGGAVEPLVGAPQAVEPARIGRIGVIDGAALAHEGAQPRPVARIGGRVGAAHFRELVLRRLAPALLAGAPHERRLALVVVIDVPAALLLFAEEDTEVGVEVARRR